MSMLYRIEVQLSISANKENIKHILNRGLAIGSTYYHLDINQIQKNTIAIEESELHLDDAVTFIFANIQKDPTISTSQFQNNTLIPGIKIKLLDTVFHLSFYSTEPNKLVVDMSPACPIWEIVDEDGFAKIDFVRYIEVMMKLCKGFVIEKIEVEVT